MVALRLISRQRQIGVQLSQKEPVSRRTADQIAVLALPAQARFLRQRFFQHRRRVDKSAVAETADGCFDPGSQALQSVAHQSVVIPAQRIA